MSDDNFIVCMTCEEVGFGEEDNLIKDGWLNTLDGWVCPDEGPASIWEFSASLGRWIEKI